MSLPELEALGRHDLKPETVVVCVPPPPASFEMLLFVGGLVIVPPVAAGATAGLRRIDGDHLRRLAGLPAPSDVVSLTS